VNREIKLNEQVVELTEKVQAAANENVNFQILSAREQRAGPARCTAAQKLVQEQQEREQKLQQKYKELLDKRDALQNIKISAAS